MVIQQNSDISNSVFTNTWCISKCYQGPILTPFTSRLNKLGYIELYILKTRIYRSFSEVPCHLNQCKLPFIYQTLRNHFNLLSFVINASKSIDISQFLDRQIPFIYQTLWTHWKQSTFHSFAIERRRHCFYYINQIYIIIVTIILLIL